jgi:uncharacterized damage-inducible protein DinB
MNRDEVKKQLEFTRKKTLELLAIVEKLPDPAAALGWRPGPGRAPLAWQFMHMAATDDRHVNARVGGGTAKEPDYERRFAGGSVPDDQTPSIEEIRRYLAEHRAALLLLLESSSDEAFARKPYEASPYTLEEWFRVWIWHEAHHQGQAHLTLNLHKSVRRD